MGIETLIAAVGISSSALGGWMAGRRGARSEALEEAESLRDVLKEKIDLLEEGNAEKEDRIRTLEERMSYLGELVTQRAAVGDLAVLVKELDDKVDRIVRKLDA